MLLAYGATPSSYTLGRAMGVTHPDRRAMSWSSAPVGVLRHSTTIRARPGADDHVGGEDLAG